MKNTKRAVYEMLDEKRALNAVIENLHAVAEAVMFNEERTHEIQEDIRKYVERVSELSRATIKELDKLDNSERQAWANEYYETRGR